LFILVEESKESDYHVGEETSMRESEEKAITEINNQTDESFPEDRKVYP